MPRLRQAVAQLVADRLFAAEAAIDEALTCAAELTAAMPRARIEARLPAVIGQDALDTASEAFMALVEARRRIVETHKLLDSTRAEIGLREVNAGDSYPKPNPAQTAHLVEVGSPLRMRAVA